MTATARKATFDASDQRRRSLLAKVHIAKSQLRLCDDDYVAILIDVVGTNSAGKCTVPQLEKLVRAFEAKGFKATARAPSRRGNPAVADHPAARKARAMWISLHLLGRSTTPATVRWRRSRAASSIVTSCNGRTSRWSIAWSRR